MRKHQTTRFTKKWRRSSKRFNSKHQKSTRFLETSIRSEIWFGTKWSSTRGRTSMWFCTRGRNLQLTVNLTLSKLLHEAFDSRRNLCLTQVGGLYRGAHKSGHCLGTGRSSESPPSSFRNRSVALQGASR